MCMYVCMYVCTLLVIGGVMAENWSVLVTIIFCIIINFAVIKTFVVLLKIIVVINSRLHETIQLKTKDIVSWYD